jgi:amino acid adenylation domain-containing protein
VDGSRRLTYAELDERSSRLARFLADLGVERSDRVGLFLEKSLESLVGIYGTLKAGAAYVPLDPTAPSARIAYMVRDCGIRLLLTGMEKAEAWDEIAGGGAIETVVVLNGSGSTLPPHPPGLRLIDAAAAPAADPGPPAASLVGDDLAYILYTSGSTGHPKGVMLSHRNALNFVDWARGTLRLGPEDRLSSHAPLHFDLSIFDIFAAAASGGSVWLVPRSASVLPAGLARWIAGSRISVWYSVPSVLSMLVRLGGLRPGGLPHLRAVVFAGEVFPTKYLRRLMRLIPDAEYHNWYGPTETNVCTAHRVPEPPEDQDDPIPIGSAIDNMEVFAVTDEGRRSGPGEVGELHVRGAGVMRGYWGDPERTARALVPDPVGEDGDLVYRTGDLVEDIDGASYRFLGRRDSQVKSRGYRIDLGDVESALLAHPAVVEATVVAVPDELVTNRIEAFVVTTADLSRSDLMRFCGERVPRYMIPESIEFRQDLPRTSTGKVDRQTLLNLSTRRSG